MIKEKIRMLKNIIYNSDCLETMSKMESNSIDMILVDLPFFQVCSEKWDSAWKSETEYLEWIEKNIIECHRLLKPGRNIFMFTGRSLNRHISIILDKYFVEQRIIIWARKRNFNTCRGKALSSGYEPICFYSKGKQTIFNSLKIKDRHNRRKEYVSGYLKDGVNLSDVFLDIAALPHNSKERVKHPTQKPVELIKRLVSIGSNENDLILDFCAGSGTTGVACKELNRNYILIDNNFEYCKLMKHRLC